MLTILTFLASPLLLPPPQSLLTLASITVFSGVNTANLAQPTPQATVRNGLYCIGDKFTGWGMGFTVHVYGMGLLYGE